MVTRVLSYVFEAVGVFLLAGVVGAEFGWPWAAVPVAVYLLLLGFSLDRGDVS